MTAATGTGLIAKARSVSSLGAVALETRALLWAAMGFVFGAALAVIYQGQLVPLSGDHSVGMMASIAGPAFAAVAFCTSYLRSMRNADLAWRRGLPLARQILDIVGLAFLHIAIVFLLCLVGFSVLQNAFKGLQLDGFATGIIVGLVVAICGYFTYLGAASISSYTLSTLLAVFIAGGALVSMSTSDDPNWWKNNFSALGQGDAFSAWAFNITMIIAGIVITTLADYMMADLRVWAQRSPRYRSGHITALAAGLVALGLLLLGVGVFPVDRVFIVHNIMATGMIVVFIVMVASLRWMIPGFSEAFFTLSYIMLAGVILAIVLFFPVGYLGFTAAELVIAALIFSWLIVFVRNIGAAVQDHNSDEAAKAMESARA